MRDFVKKWILPPGVAGLINRVRTTANSYRLRTAEDRALLNDARNLKGRNKGQRCFILGAGPSVKSQDLKKLAGECVISVSNTFVHPDFKLIHPKYHVTPHMRFGHGHLYSDEKFVKWLKEMDDKTLDAELFFHIGDKGLIDNNGLFNDRVIHWVDFCAWNGDFDTPVDLARVPYIWSVSELVITIAIYLGFDEIYLLGIDHDWFNGLVHFYDRSKDHAMEPHKSGLSVDAEFQMRRHADIFKKYKYLYSIRQNIFNANSNPNHYLDVFPKVDFDSLFPAGKEGGSCAG